MSTLTFEPIAQKIARMCDVAQLVPPLAEVQSQLRREGEELNRSFDPGSSVEGFMLHYLATARGANELVGAPPFARLLELFERIQDEYMPGGPPMSPVYDSFFMSHVLLEIPQGPSRETPYTVLAWLARGRRGLEGVAELARSTARSHMDLYRAREVAGTVAELDNVRTGGSVRVHLTGPFLRTDDLLLGRVVSFRGEQFMADSPYLLRASEREWLDYLARAARPPSRRESAPTKPAGEDKRSRKQRQAAKQRAAQASAGDDAVVRHLRYGPDWRYWLDFVMDAYAGERRGICYLVGVPDRPEQLPHNADYRGDPEATPAIGSDEGRRPVDLAAMRDALFAVAERLGLPQVLRAELEGCGVAEGAAVPPDVAPLLLAVTIYGLRDRRGMSATDHYLRSGDVTPGEREFLEGVLEGWFSLFEIRRVHLDEGLDVMDVLRRKAIHIAERAATRQVAPGQVLAGWVTVDGAGDYRLEGSVILLPVLFAAPLVEGMKAARAALPSGLSWRQRAERLPIPLVAGLLAARERGPVLQNTSGEPLVLSTARYDVLDDAAVRTALARRFEDLGDGAFVWDEGDVVIARLQLEGAHLTAAVNSVERLARVKDELERLLGVTVRPSLGSVDGGAHDQRRRAGAPEPMELPPEVEAALHEAALATVRKTLDQPIPMFGDKTLRQLARGKKSRVDAVGWLREQERMFRSNPQTAQLDMRGIWQELGLPYQGLDTDPER